MKPHIALAHHLWTLLLTPNDSAIDATCGNGHDTEFLARLLPNGLVYSYDIQHQGLEKTKKRLGDHSNIVFKHECHTQMKEAGVKLVVYNLGYLPGGDKSITTHVDSTLKSVSLARELLAPGGMISITCYPGHNEGEQEQEALLEWAKGLESHSWSVSHHTWINRPKSPTLLILKKGDFLSS